MSVALHLFLILLDDPGRYLERDHPLVRDLRRIRGRLPLVGPHPYHLAFLPLRRNAERRRGDVGPLDEDEGT